MPAAFSQAFPPLPVPGSTPLLNWNTDIANAIDIVPHAWDRLPLIIQPDAAGNFASLFGVMAGTSSNPLVPALGKTIATAVSKAETMSGGALYYQHLPMIQFSTAKDYYSWICDNQGNYTYPPQKLALPVYTDTVTTSSVGPMTTLAELGQYLDATHIDHYLFFFDVMPIARMPDPLKGKLQTLAHEAKAG